MTSHIRYETIGVGESSAQYQNAGCAERAKDRSRLLPHRPDRIGKQEAECRRRLPAMKMAERANRRPPYRGLRIIQTVEDQWDRLQIPGSGESVQGQFSDAGAVVIDELAC